MNNPIINSHCHLYPEAILSKAVKGIESFYDYRYTALDGSISTLLKEGRECGISHYVIFSVATAPHQVHSINSYIAKEVDAGNGIFTGLGTLHPCSNDIESDFEELCSFGLKGVKLHPDIQKIPIDDERCQKIYRLCQGKIPVLIHTGDYRYDYSNPLRMKKMLEEFPECTFIGAHFGGWSVQSEAVKLLAGYPNFYVDTSSSLFDVSFDTVKMLINRYTPEKILFATDYPLGNMAKELEIIKKAVDDKDSLERILYKNAAELFKIKF